MAQAVPLSPALPADWRDFLALTKPRVMTLVVYTGLAGMLAAATHVHPVVGWARNLADAYCRIVRGIGFGTRIV